MQISFQNVLKVNANPNAVLGARAETPDGGQWVYIRANEALARYAVAIPIALTDVSNVASSSTNAAGQIVYITKTSAGWTGGQFENAWINIYDGTNEGQVAKVKTNTADTLELYPQWALASALSTDSDVYISRFTTLHVNAAITDKAQNAVGIVQVAFTTASPYGWALFRGMGGVIAGEVLTADLSFVTGDDTVGQVLKGTTAKGPFDEQSLGTVIGVNTTADKTALVHVSIGL